MSRKKDFNIIVIGAGSGGLVSAYIAAAAKAKVLLVEKNKMGGDCLNTGCVPSKALIQTASLIAKTRRAKEFGLKKIEVEFDFKEIMERVHRVIKEIEPHDSVERYTSLGVDCIKGEAQIESPQSVRIGSKTYSTQSIILATGASPVIPKIQGLDFVPHFTSDTIWSLRELPRRLCVLGGGPIGVELAQCFQRLGSQVTLLEAGTRILSKEDSEVSELVEKKLHSEGMSILTHHSAQEFRVQGNKNTVICKTPAGQKEIEFDVILLALGRKSHTHGLGLEKVGVQLGPNGAPTVNSKLQTTVPQIYACGDVIGPYQFTHAASHQAWYASVNALLRPFWSFDVDYRVIPWCTFSDPEVARVGLNEIEAKALGTPYQISQYSLDDLDRAITDQAAHGFVKVLTAPGSDRILGVTIVGEHAGEMIAEFVTAMKHGLGLNKILSTIHIYPTFMEANKYVAGVWKRSQVRPWQMTLAERFMRWRR